MAACVGFWGTTGVMGAGVAVLGYEVDVGVGEMGVEVDVGMTISVGAVLTDRAQEIKIKLTSKIRMSVLFFIGTQYFARNFPSSHYKELLLEYNDVLSFNK